MKAVKDKRISDKTKQSKDLGGVKLLKDLAVKKITPEELAQKREEYALIDSGLLVP